MSYILEALRRSQAERELGRVPTLEGAALVAEDPAKPPQRWPWALVSVALASAAVLIALYAALRSPEGVRGATPGTVVARQASAVANPLSQVPLPQSPIPQPQTIPGAIAPLHPTPAGADPAAGTPTDGGDRGLPSPPPQPETLPAIPAVAPRVATTAGVPPSTAVGAAGSVPADAPLVEAPPPKSLARVSPPDPTAPPMGDGAVVTGPAAKDDAAAQLELELQRQLESDPAAAQNPASVAPEAAREDPGPTPIPPDLIADIDAFKHQVKGGPGKGKGKEKEKEKEKEKGKDAQVVATAPQPTAAPAPAGDPTQLRLTHDQEAALPKFMMTVHVYDPQAPRRFVLINGVKYGEGAKTREGLTVEEIRADGAVLAHQGHPFFVHR